MTYKPEPEPCPLCRGEAISAIGRYTHLSQVWCSNCHLTLQRAMPKEDLIELWNTRPEIGKYGTSPADAVLRDARIAVANVKTYLANLANNTSTCRYCSRPYETPTDCTHIVTGVFHPNKWYHWPLILLCRLYRTDSFLICNTKVYFTHEYATKEHTKETE